MPGTGHCSRDQSAEKDGKSTEMALAGFWGGDTGEQAGRGLRGAAPSAPRRGPSSTDTVEVKVSLPGCLGDKRSRQIEQEALR